MTQGSRGARSGTPPTPTNAAQLPSHGAAPLSYVVGWSRFEVTRRTNARLAKAGDRPDLGALPNLAWALAGGGGEPDYDQGFRYGVDLLIAGLERRLPGRHRPPGL
jgi:hypothetical protein